MIKNHFRVPFLLFFIVLICFFHSCTKRKAIDVLGESCYPEDVGAIFITKCAISGCHNTLSHEAAGGLDLSSWNKMLEGANGGAAVVAYRSDQSFLMNFINTYDDLGPKQLPTMPNNGTPLTRDEVLLIKNWIDQGAPDCNGTIPFSGDPNRKKFYVTNQGCDLIAVWDAEKKIIMRYVSVGGNPNAIESPHMVRISPDGQFWYISFTGSNARYFQKYRTSDDSFVAQVDLTMTGSWNTFAFSPDSKWAYLPDFNSSELAIVDCENMTLKAGTPFKPDQSFSVPHGSVVSPDGNYLYITLQNGDEIYKMETTFPYDGHNIYLPGTALSKPHEVAFSPDGSKYFVTCQATDTVKVFNALTDLQVAAIPVGVFPQEMSFSTSTNYLFVSCMYDHTVSVIDYVNNTFVKSVSGFNFPHGIAVDDAKGVCYVANRNTSGPPPHHTSACGGRNGFLSAIDLNILSLVPGFKPELSVDPYSIAIRK